MEQALRDVSQMAFSLVVSLAPVVALVVLLNRRDRRERALFADACGAFSSQALRSDVAIRVRCRLVSRRALVTVDMPLWSRDELWDCLTRLRRRLPPRVQLRLDGPMEPALHTRLTVDRVDAGGRLGVRTAW
jgi:hypothetical protein